ncbi:MAG: hypothetical protein GXP43_00460 [bacterium]|nr:hypothetical protein [bacterium]
MHRDLLKKAAALVSVLSLTLGAAVNTYAYSLGQTGNSALGNDGVTVVSLVANGGLLTHQAPTDVSLGSIITSTSDQTMTGTATGYLVDNARGYNTTDEPGWTATATFTDLTSSKGTIDVTNFTVTPQNLTVLSGSSTGVSLGSSTSLTDTDDDGTSNALTWITASAGSGMGRYSSDLGILLTVPANTPAGDYSSTVTITVS